ncbi:hypothetical protein TCAL_10260 [Tigriopus californicus]|uniref:Uncharacterized protein n=2 Tax=Tigriopus californicus TaxID=6832 RepID=A0A553PQ85_TIGCA|nr:hypothetical protein TCAL_10260 [Tigriopus californicus]|eukprot:TCALIF_10260-PA protein Name:"Protein of unknown function" AED:0.00 eAED:0.00 QI:183/1/1/1/0.5/0.33/3/383/291
MPGFWKRPVTRMYSYNLDLGEHYYYPISHYLEAERGTRGETPGALTFNERLARRWLHGRRYGATDLSDRYSRASSLSRFDGDWSYLAGEMSNRSARARSEVRTSSAGYDANNVSAFANYKNALLDTSRELRQEASANLMAREQSRSHSLANMRAEAASRRSAFQQMRASTPMTATANTESSSTTRSSYRTESKRRIEDDICKKVADVHMMPWALGTELDEAQSASARARSRISELERELEEITKRAMTTSTHARRTAAQLAKEASLEDEQAMASTYKKSRKVMIQSAQRAC